jgi:hypothetical protein
MSVITDPAEPPLRLPDLLRPSVAEEYHIPPQEEPSSLQLTCRVCYEQAEEGSLLHPCKCTGSLKYIHEDCLKTWIVSSEDQVEQGHCEVCNTSFNIKFTVARECSVWKGCRESKAVCRFVPMLTLVMVMLGGVVYVLVAFYLRDSSSAEEQGYAAALIGICVSAAVVLSALLVHASKQSCIFSVLKHWEILNLDLDEQELSRLDDSSKEFSKLGLLTPRSRDDGVLVVPKKIKIGKFKVKTPLLRPNLALLRAKGRRTVYASPRIAQSLSITPVRSQMISIEPTIVRCTSFPTMQSSKVVPTTSPLDETTKQGVQRG